MPPTRTASTSQGRAVEEDRTFSASMRRFYQICSVPLILAATCAGMAINAANTIPARGDQTLRYISIWVPGFWALLLPLAVLGLALYYRGQSVTISRKAFIYRRGSFTSIIQWFEARYSPPQSTRFDRQATVASKDSVVLLRSLFFPDFEEMSAIIEKNANRRDSGEYVL